MACPNEWRQAGGWEPWPVAWNRLGLSTNELAVMTALLSAAWSDPFENEAEFQQAAGGLGRNKLREAVRGVERRGLLTRHRAAVHGNGKRYVLHHEPVPEGDRTGEDEPAVPTARRRRNADALTASTTGRPVVEESSDPTHSENRNSSAENQPASTTGRPVAQGSTTGRPGPSTTGRPVAPPLQTSSDTSSSVGSSSTTHVDVERAEEEEASAEAAMNRETWEPAARDLVAGVVFKPGRFLMSEARERVVELLIGHLQAGYQPSWLRKRLYEWSNEAINPSTYFVQRLEGLGPPRPKLTVVTEQRRDDPSNESVTTDEAPSSPVPWLTDAQFAALPKQLRAAATAIGERPTSELPSFDQRQYASICTTLDDAEIADKGA